MPIIIDKTRRFPTSAPPKLVDFQAFPAPAHSIPLFPAFYHLSCPLTGYHVLEWDGTVLKENAGTFTEANGRRPVIYPENEDDAVIVSIVLRPIGYPNERYWCDELPEYDDEGNVVGIIHNGTNRSWSVDYAAASEDIIIDYKLKAYLIVSNGIVKDCTEGMQELFERGELNPQYAGRILDFKVEDPVNMIDGNYYASYTDLRIEGAYPLSHVRFYNSLNTGGTMGAGHSHGYDYQFIDNGKGTIKIYTPQGEGIAFLELEDGSYHPMQHSQFELSFDGTGYTMTHEGGAEFYFEDELLQWAKNPSGVTIAELSYNGTELDTITGALGQGTLFFTWQSGRIIAVADHTGRQVTYTYDGDGNLASMTNPDGDSLGFYYENGLLTETTDFEGTSYLYNTYDDKGRVIQQKYMMGDEYTISRFRYDEESRMNTFIDSTGWEVRYYYDDYRNLIRVEDDNGTLSNAYTDNRPTSYSDKLDNEIDYELNDEGKIETAIYPDGMVVSFTYTGDQIETITYNHGADGSIEYAYDGKGNVTSVTDQNGYKTKYTYNSDSLLTKIEGELGYAEEYGYFAGGLMSWSKDANGNTTHYEYDGVGRLTKITDPMLVATEYSYSGAGKLSSVTEAVGTPLERTTSYDYNGNGFLTETVYPKTDEESAAPTTSALYGANGQILSSTDLLGNITTYKYDNHGNLVLVSAPEGNVTTYAYDELNRLSSVTDADGVETSYEYNAMDQLEKIISVSADGNLVTRQEYDSMGRLERVTAPDGGETVYTYDSVGRMETIRDAEGNTTSYQYDKAGNLTQETDGASNTTLYTYNRLNRLSSITDAENYVTSFTYDQIGQITKINYPEGLIQTYDYDKNGNLLKSVYGGAETTYEYDALNRLVKQINPDITTQTMSYDARDRLIELTDELNRLTKYAYDTAGNVLAIQVPAEIAGDPSVTTAVTGFSYTAAGQLKETVYPNNSTEQYTYSAAGRLLSQTDRSGLTTTYTYNDRGQIASTWDTVDDKVFFTYDALGNPATQAFGTEGNIFITNEYNHLGRISQSTDAYGEQARYTYDGAGNLKTYQDKNGNTTTYLYDGVNNLIELRDAVNGAVNPKVFEYDGLGRQTKAIDNNGNATTYQYDFRGNITQVSDALGQVTVNTYDIMNHLTKQEIKETASAPATYIYSYVYDDAGRVLQVTEPGSCVSSYDYDVSDRVTKTTDPANQDATMTYDIMGNLLSYTDVGGNLYEYTYGASDLQETSKTPLGAVTNYTYTPHGRVDSVTYHDTGCVRYAYDGRGNLVSVTDQRDFETKYEYDKLDRLTQSIDGAGFIQNYNYDAERNLTRVTNANWEIIQAMDYDAINRPIAQADGEGGVGIGESAVRYTYDPNGNVVTKADKLGNETQYTYDALNRITTVTDALNGEVSYRYDLQGRVLEHRDAVNNENSVPLPTVSNVYDIRGNLIKTTDAENNTISYTYDALDRITSTTDRRNATTSYTYNETGAVLTITDSVLPTGFVTKYTYDAMDNLLTIFDREQQTEKFTYDEMGRRRSYVNGLGNVEWYNYDLAGNLERVRDRNQNTTQYSYDGLNRIAGEVNAAGEKIEYAYDYLGNIASVTTNNGAGGASATRYRYDLAGNLISEIKPIDGADLNVYDPQGNLISSQNRNGDTTTYSYDALNRLSEKLTAEGDVHTYAYDANGNLISAQNDVAETLISYDLLNRVTEVSEALTGFGRPAEFPVRVPQSRVTAYQYDENSNIVKITYPDTTEVEYTYDSQNWSTSVNDGESWTKHFYDYIGQLTKEEHSDGSTTMYAYDAFGQLQSMRENEPNGDQRRDIQYGYDPNGNLITERRIATGVNLDKPHVSYEYDAANRLTDVTETNGHAVTYQAYGYDTAGNLVSENNNGATVFYTYDQQNRLTAKGGTAYTYDKEGNLLSDGANTYTYDGEGRMILGTNKQGETSNYSYNALGARVLNVQEQKNINYDFRSHIGLGSRYLTHDYLDIYKIDRNDWQPTWETSAGHIVQLETATYAKEYVVDYLSLANRDLMVYNEGEFTERHVYDRNFQRVSTTFAYADETSRGEPGENIASDTAVGHTDKLLYRTSHLSSTLFAVDETGAVALHMMYDAWGNPQVDTAFNVNKSGVSNLNNYTGYTYDDVLGIYYAQNRFYDAGIKRFIQEDPIKDGMNWYSYVGNNPVNRVDPLGLFRDGDILEYDYGVYKTDNVLLQKKLSELDLYHGPIDGMFGGDTLEAVNDFLTLCLENGHYFDFINGKVNTATWKELGLPISAAPSPNIPASDAIIGTGDDKKGAVSYILYDSRAFEDGLKKASTEAHVAAYQYGLATVYGYAPTKIDITYWTDDDFITWWNALDGRIDSIVLMGHGNSQVQAFYRTGNSGITIDKLNDGRMVLDPKDVKLMLFTGCNTGVYDYTYHGGIDSLSGTQTNVVKAFSEYIAPDGYVVGVDGAYFSLWDSPMAAIIADSGFHDSRGEKRDPVGFVGYTSGLEEPLIIGWPKENNLAIMSNLEFEWNLYQWIYYYLEELND